MAAEETFVVSKEETKSISGLIKAMERADGDIPDMLSRKLLPIARNIAELARKDVPRKETKDHPAGTGAASIIGDAGKRGASIKFGGSSAPYEPWLDFGGSVGRGHKHGHTGSAKTHNYKKWQGGGAVFREMVKGGRYVYPTIMKEQRHTLDQVEAAVAEVFETLDFQMTEDNL